MREIQDPFKGWYVYGKPKCPWCDRVKVLLEANGIIYRYIDIATDDHAVRNLVEQGIRTVPQVYHDGTRIGSYEQTDVYLRGLTA